MAERDTFGTRLTVARRARGLTQSALARAADISGDTTISRYERNEAEPRTDTMGRIADALGVPFEWLALGRGDLPQDVIAAIQAAEAAA